MTSPTTALIILNYNNCRDTRNCIRSILQFNTAPIKIILVDNASKPEERGALTEFFVQTFPEGLVLTDTNGHNGQLPFATLVLNDKNSGYAQGNNLGLKLAYDDPQIDQVMVLNNDVLFINDLIPQLTARKAALHDCAIISPALLKPDKNEFDYNCARRNEKVSEMIGENFLHYWRVLRKHTAATVHPDRYLLMHADNLAPVMPIELPSGSCMLIDKSLMKDIGSFDPNTFLYYEENILYQKIRKLGLRNYLCTDLRCIHIGAATTSRAPSSMFVVNAAIASQRYYVKHYSQAGSVLRMLHHLSSAFYSMSIRLQKHIGSIRK